MLSLKYIIIFILAWQFCLAQDNNAYFHHLTIENGLSEATNYYVYKDSRGFVWISSISGLNRFDGRHVQVYQPESADAYSLYGQNIQSSFFEDNQGNIWFGTYEGLNKYSRKSDNFEHFTVMNNESKQPFTGYRLAYLDDKEQLWLLINEQYVFLFDTKTHQFIKKHNVMPNSQHFHVQTDAQKQIKRSFVNTNTTGIFGIQMTQYLNGDSIKQEKLFYSYSDNVSLNISPPLTIFDLFFENETVWIASHIGLFRFNFESKAIDFYRDRVVILCLSLL